MGSNSCAGHFIFYGKVRQCDVPVSQRLTKNSLLQGEMVHFKGSLKHLISITYYMAVIGRKLATSHILH